MQKWCLSFWFIWLATELAHSQNSTSLFDERKLCTIKISIHPDSLSYLYANVLSNRYFRCTMVFHDGLVADTVSNVGFRLRGNTSRYSQKKSFKLSFNEFVAGRRYQGVKKFNLNGQHNDPTMVREKLFYHIWNRAGLPKRRTTFVKVFINGSYFGLYTGLEEFDKDWLGLNFQENEGNLYKCTFPAPLAYLGGNPEAYQAVGSASATGGRAYDLETNELEDNYADLVSLATALNQPVNEQLPAHITQVLNVEMFLKALAIDVATGNWDNYAYNKNNYFLYHNLAANRFDFISYDTDNTFGIGWSNINWSTRNCNAWIHPTEPRPLASKVLAVPQFKARYIVLLDSITRTIVAPDSIFPTIDWMENFITEAAETDLYRTLDYNFSISDFHAGFSGAVGGHVPIGIKPFLVNRYQATLSQISAVAPPQSVVRLKVFPNPTDAFLWFENVMQEDEHKAMVEITDVCGKRIRSLALDKMEKSRMDVRELNSGLYFVTVSSGEKKDVISIIKR